MSIFFLSKKLASFCHKNSVLTDYYSQIIIHQGSMWVIGYVTLLRLGQVYNMSRHNVVVVKTSSSEDNLNG